MQLEELVFVVVLALMGGAYWVGERNGENACVAAQAKVVQVEQVAANKESDRREVIGVERETAREQIRIVYRTIREKADETVKNDPEIIACGLDADGLREWNAANSGGTQTLPGEPDSGLPSPATGEIRQPGGLVQQSYRFDGAGSTVPGSAAPAGGMREGAQ
jgi:hypothetical protein